MKDLFNNIVSNIIATILIGCVTAAIGYVVAKFNPVIIPYVVIVAVSITIFFAFFYLYSFGQARFNWTHVHLHDVHCFTLKSDGTASDSEKLQTIKQRGFEGIITGNYFGDDVSLKRFEIKSQDAEFTASFQYEDGANNRVSRKNDISISGNLSSVDYQISFANNIPEDVTIEVSMGYNPKQMTPQYYVEVFRPVKKLALELRVQRDVKIRNIKREIWSIYGDKKDVHIKELKGKKCWSDNSLTSYKFVVRNPRILHTYKITWDWIE